ncbi:Pet127-domain-containing protein [Aspergillus heteromorphus CBS 117.55]|uniref:Pet127-domain-containing protein n=1 Tax=Aspergillus heteromorphus CBS 117.55 TaxID=1448321 RepID=A0A317WAT6_9EURO|nr:Pet127-domain-containing protein [Aspergillus heteromorphus CBS 117.55]PWY83015.1 Pet127-domain-containing protein [Aspergillus heteromorphus CBS 117.55]
MLRPSLRSVSGPLREHVCLSCRTHTRRFHVSPRWRNEPPQSSPTETLHDSLKSLPFTGTPPPPSVPAGSKPPTDEAKPLTEENQSPKGAAKKPEQAAKPSKKAVKPSEKAAKPSEKAAKLPIRKIKAQPDSGSLSFLQSSVIDKEIGRITADGQSIKPLDVPCPPVPRLAYGLDRVLFNPGVYQLRDPRSRVYNFDPYLGSIMPVTEFDFDTLKPYITSSKDVQLRDLARQEKKKYIGSSSSMTSVLSQFHYLLSQWREVNTESLSRSFPEDLKTFTRLLRAPSAMFLRYQDGAYAIDADKEHDTANILMNLGKSMEKLLTMPKEEFERYRRSSENKISVEEEQAIPESYHYSTAGDFLMRSQLDAYDPRLPGTGMFDLKTRAVASIRMDAKNFEHGMGYEIRSAHGMFESYEREYYDMIRAALLKYALQVRIGRMDGIFVAFHNIERIFGFQYLSLSELDLALHGQEDTNLGNREFLMSLQLWSKILDQATAKFPKQSIRLHFETREAVQEPFMYIFAEPVTEEEIHAIQTKNQAEIDAYQRRVLNLSVPDEAGDAAAAAAMASASADAEETLREESLNSADESKPEPETQPETKTGASEKEIFAMTLSIKNLVNGKQVPRPEKLKASHRWCVNYEFHHIGQERARKLYTLCQNRREKALVFRDEDGDVPTSHYIRKLRDIASKGRQYRKKQDLRDSTEEPVIFGHSS